MAISKFSPKKNENFYKCWERYKELLNACPHHDHETWSIVSYFYESLTLSMRIFVETMCNGQFFSKNPEEALLYFDQIAEGPQNWNTYTEETKAKPSERGVCTN